MATSSVKNNKTTLISIRIPNQLKEQIDEMISLDSDLTTAKCIARSFDLIQNVAVKIKSYESIIKDREMNLRRYEAIFDRLCRNPQNARQILIDADLLTGTKRKSIIEL